MRMKKILLTERVELGEEGDGSEADEGEEDDEKAGDRLRVPVVVEVRDRNDWGGLVVEED